MYHIMDLLFIFIIYIKELIYFIMLKTQVFYSKFEAF